MARKSAAQLAVEVGEFTKNYEFSQRLREVAARMSKVGESMSKSVTTPLPQFSHRNGETSAPTEGGWYWFDGTVDGDAYQGMAIAELKYDEIDVWSNTLLGWNRMSGETLVGRFWGPLVPPWEQDATRDL
jgi:hypothetical protein